MTTAYPTATALLGLHSAASTLASTPALSTSCLDFTARLQDLDAVPIPVDDLVAALNTLGRLQELVVAGAVDFTDELAELREVTASLRAATTDVSSSIPRSRLSSAAALILERAGNASHVRGAVTEAEQIAEVLEARLTSHTVRIEAAVDSTVRKIIEGRLKAHSVSVDGRLRSLSTGVERVTQVLEARLGSAGEIAVGIEEVKRLVVEQPRALREVVKEQIGGHFGVQILLVLLLSRYRDLGWVLKVVGRRLIGVLWPGGRRGIRALMWMFGARFK